MDSIVFKELAPAHLPEVLEIYNYYVLNSTATFHIRPRTLDEMKGMVFFEHPKYKTFAILNGSTICGYVSLAQYKNREAFDATAEVALYLRQDFTGRGTGNAALTFIEQYARVNGMHVLIAAITGGNTRSIRLFEKNGYVKCAHYKEVGKKMGQQLDLEVYQKIMR